MIGAARSGRQNIIEGSERASTSKETEMKLTDVSRASLAELLGDYEIYLADKESIPWSREVKESEEFSKILIPDYKHTSDAMHDYWDYYHQQVKSLFKPWLGHANSIVVANCMIILIQRTMGMLQGQLKVQGNSFLHKGGFKERMYESRTSTRDAGESADNAPECPECGKTMRRRMPRRGCPDFPKCRGTKDWGNDMTH